MNLRPVVLFAFLCFPAMAHSAVIAGPVTNPANGHIYYLLSPGTWNTAETEAISMGGHLVTINNTNENTWVTDTFAFFNGQPIALWIGLSDRVTEGRYEWASGEPFLFEHWEQGEPNNSNDFDQDFVHTYHRDLNAAVRRRWNDLQGTNTMSGVYPLHGVVEVVPGTAALLSIRTAVEIAWESQTTNRYQ